MSQHFVAHLKIERVDKIEQQAGRSFNPNTGTRDVTEVTQFTIKADDLQTLIGKLTRHIQIIEE